jgi:circadian clock protein KaiC
VVERIKTGVEGLDRCLEGGFPGGTVILLTGGPGAGKTLFGLNFLITGAAAGERCCYVSFSESREELLRACDGVKTLAAAKNWLGRNLIIITPDLSQPRAVQEFIETLKNYPSVDRLVVDSLNKLHLYSNNDRYYKLRLSDLANHLRERVGCSLLLYEAEDGKIDTGNWEASECDGVVNLSFLEYEEKPVRTLTVHKLRYTGFEPWVERELIIDEKGLRCRDNQGIRKSGGK